VGGRRRTPGPARPRSPEHAVVRGVAAHVRPILGDRDRAL